jgi:mRNA interferase MazF
MMTPPDPRRGEIWRVNLEPTRGDEMGKTRPVVVLNGTDMGRLALRIVVPITDWKDRYIAYLWMTRLEPDAANGLTKTSAADAFQVRSVSLARFQEYVGVLPNERVDRIWKSLTICTR